MLLRELVRRHLDQGARIAVAGDPELFPDLGRVSTWSPATTWEGEPPVAVLVDLADSEALARWAARWPEVDTWVLVDASPVAQLPVGPVVSAARAQGLHLVEAVPLQHRHKTGIVASRAPRPAQGYLNGQQPGVQEADAVARITWEWGLGSLVQRARESAVDAELARLTAQLEAADERAAAREARIRESASFVLGQHLVRLRRHPLSATRALLADGRRLRRSRGGSSKQSAR